MKYTEEEKEAIDEAKTIVSIKYGSIMHIEIRNMEKILNLLEKQQKEIERLEKTIDENIVIEPDETGCHEELNIHIKDFIPKDTIREKIKEIEDSLKEDCIALHEFQRLAKIDVLKELLGE